MFQMKKKKVLTPKAEEAKPQIQNPGYYSREAGILMLHEDFKKETITPLVHSIVEYNLMPEELQPERITLVINSPGGSIDSCCMLIDAMKTSKIPVDTFAMGLAASCGIATLMAGAHRRASSTAQLMSHQYASGSRGKEHELFGRMKSWEMTSEWMIEHYRKCTGLSAKKIRKELLCPTDVWLSAAEAKDYNIIDEVVETY